MDQLQTDAINTKLNMDNFVQGGDPKQTPSLTDSFQENLNSFSADLKKETKENKMNEPGHSLSITDMVTADPQSATNSLMQASSVAENNPIEAARKQTFDRSMLSSDDSSVGSNLLAKAAAQAEEAGIYGMEGFKPSLASSGFRVNL